MKVENMNIYGGNQQFADKIINSNNELDETDKKLLRLIYDNTSDEDERKELVKSLRKIKEKDLTDKKSINLLRKFIDSSVGEAGKQLVKEMIENGASYLELLM